MLRDLNAGDRYIGPHTVGLVGSTIPGEGENGPGYLYPVVQNDSNLIAAEVRGAITLFPQHGTLFAYDDSSFVYTPTQEGNDSFLFQTYVNGVVYGDPLMVELVSGGTVVVPDAPKVSFTARLMNHLRAIGF